MLTLLVTGVVLLYRIGDMPVEQFDEARVANNALEMSNGGLSLVTTYLGQPDHYNTKPPLLVWAMYGTFQVLGPTELAVRLPSVLAAGATALLVFTFCAVRLRRPLAGVVSAAVLFAIPDEFLFHGARSGDYDALLALWTTVFLLASYLYFSDGAKRQGRWLTIAAVALALGFMTKSVEAFVFVPVIPLYAVFTGRLRTMFADKRVWVAAAGVTAVVIMWGVARELADPGYLAAALQNDVFGRSLSVIEGHAGDLFYYVSSGEAKLAMPALVIATLIASLGRPQLRRLARFTGLSMAVYLVAISLVATKAPWYLLPLFPLAALEVALSMEAIRDFVVTHYPRWSSLATAVITGAALVGVVAVGVLAVRGIDARISDTFANDTYQYSLFMRGPLMSAEPMDLVVVHPGYGQRVPYFAAAQFYATQLETRGAKISIQLGGDPLPPASDLLLACGPTLEDLVQSGVADAPVLVDGPCGIYRVRQAP